MRAILYPMANLTNGQEILITGDQAHHLNVVRLRAGEDVLVLNGQGDQFLTQVISLNKKEVVLKALSHEQNKRLHHISLALSLPKKDATEDIFKISTELGVKDIYLIKSQFSQYAIDDIKADRLIRLFESALVQSNNAFLPNLHPMQSLSDFINRHDNPLYFFDSKSLNSKPAVNLNPKSDVTILIGPEGGFSDEERSIILNYKYCYGVHFPSPILRAPTATSAAFGYLFSNIIS